MELEVITIGGATVGAGWAPMPTPDCPITGGGGFIGGLIGSTGFILYAIACGTDQARRALRARPETVAMIGLAIALGAGLSAALFGDVFFTGQWLFLGATETEKGLPVSTVLAFDVGVYMAVFGSILGLVFAMEEEI